MREKMAPRRAPWRRWYGVGFRRLVPLGSIEISVELSRKRQDPERDIGPFD